MTAIGGYFGLELRKGEHYHSSAIRLNSARNCLEYILRAKKYKTIYIPYYTCKVILEPIIRLGIEYRFYSIDADLNPISFPEIKQSTAFLYTNYFGLKQYTVIELSKKIENLIIDNSQAFYAPPIPGIDTFYSPRKFFGIADGGYLFTNALLDLDLEQAISYNRMSHLLKRIDLKADAGYEDFMYNDNELSGLPIQRMSKITERILESIDYDFVFQKRRENYFELDLYLKKYNQCSFEIEPDDCPMIYPFINYDNGLRQKLIQNKIYVATYWPNVIEWVENGWELFLMNNLVCIPIDQRYENKEMMEIIKYCQYE